MCITTTLGTVEQRELFAYQEVDGIKRQVACAFMVDSGGSVRLNVGDYDNSRPLVIDPLVYATYIGGGAEERAKLVDEVQEVGMHSVAFRSEGLTEGFYTCKLIVAGHVEMRKMILLK